MILSRKKTASVAKECVACGCCVKVCPVNAIRVHLGLRAVVDNNICIGCGKCMRSCPAGVVEILEVKMNEETVV